MAQLHLVRFEDFGQETKAVALLEENVGDSIIIFKKKEYILSPKQVDKLRNNNIRFSIKKTVN